MRTHVSESKVREQMKEPAEREFEDMGYFMREIYQQSLTVKVTVTVTVTVAWAGVVQKYNDLK